MQTIGAMPASWSLPARRHLALPCLFAALVAAGGYLRVPIPGNPIPLTLQTVFVLLAGAYLTPLAAALSMGLFIAAGLLGAPVFAGGGAGLAYLTGPTGGYLAGFAAAAALCAVILRGRNGSFPRTVGAMTAAALAVHLCGAIWLGMYLGGDMAAAWRFTLPFLPGDLLKVAAASAFAAGASALFSKEG